MRAIGEEPGDHVLQCMELRGGFAAVEETISMPGLDAWVFSRPHDQAEGGGDVHYVSLCGGGKITRLIVADVSGHGRAVADVSAMLRDMMRRNINNVSQTRLVRALNREFSAMAEQGRFATAVVATYLAHRRVLAVSNAGHPRPLWYRAKADDWTILSEESIGRVAATGNLPLGIDDDSRYAQFSVALAPGDLLLFHTDALTETKDASGRMLGEHGLLDMAPSLDPSAPLVFGPALCRAIEEFRGGRPAEDDVTLIVLRHNGGGPRPPSPGAMLGVMAKMLGLRAV